MGEDISFWSVKSTNTLDEIARAKGLVGMYPVGVEAAAGDHVSFEDTRGVVIEAGVYAPKEGASDPLHHYPWATGLISTGMPLGVAGNIKLSAGMGRLAGFVGRDGLNYDRFKQALTVVAQDLAETTDLGRYQISIDGHGVLDRNVALASGLGWVGKSAQVLTKDHGSWLLLGTILTENAPNNDMVRPPLESRCGGCVECVQNCPTAALGTAYRCDAGKCLSLVTQSPREIRDDTAARMGTTIYGCDVCQDVCPVNLRVPGERRHVEMIDLQDVVDSSDDELRTRFPGLYFPGKKIELLRRNAEIGLRNSRV